MVYVPTALRDGYSSKASLGAGLGTCRGTADDFDLHSAPGHGTVVMARVGDRPPAPRHARHNTRTAPVRAVGLHVRSAAAEHSGDAWAHADSGDRLTLILADGLGHGPEAARASSAAVGQLR